MSSLVKVGEPFKATYAMNPAAPAALGARVQLPTGEWNALAMVEVPTPAGHDRLFVGDFVPTTTGWYIISYETDPAGGEFMQKFYATDDWGSGGGGGGGTFQTYPYGVSTTEEV